MAIFTVTGAAGSDTITGYATGDTITVTSPYTTGGYLTLSLANSNVTVDLATTLGAAGTAIVTGGAGSDSITGGNGNDSLSGGNGNDMNPDGNDTLTGGAGSDTFNVAGTDTITDWTTNDTLIISWYATAKIAVTDFDAFVSTLNSNVATNSGVINNNYGGTLVLDGLQPATVAQALAVKSAIPSGALTFTAGISDVMENYFPVDNTAAMQVANFLMESQPNITVTNAVSVAQADELDSENGNSTLTLAGGLSDTMWGFGVGGFDLLATNPALAVTITDRVTIEQAKAIDDATTGALTIAAGISDAPWGFFSDGRNNFGATLAPGVASLLSTNPNVTFTPYHQASIAQLKAIDDLTTGTLTPPASIVGTVAQFASDVATNGGAGTYVTSSRSQISFTDSVTIAQLTAITQNYHNSIYFRSNAGITDTAANLATHNVDGTWTVNSLISQYQPQVNVSGAIDPAEVTALKNAGAWLLLETSLSAPNTFVIETASTPDVTITTNMVANVVDAAGDQTIWLDTHGKLNLSGTVGHNVIQFGNYSAADDTWYDGQLEVSRSGGTVIFADHSTHEQIASIETNANAPSQTIQFGEGIGIELTFNGSTVALDGTEIPVNGQDVLLVGLNLPTIDTWWNG